MGPADNKPSARETAHLEDEERCKHVCSTHAVSGVIDFTLEQSALGLARLWVRMRKMGVAPEAVLDLIRMPFMYASLPDKPDVVSNAVGDIDKTDRRNA